MGKPETKNLFWHKLLFNMKKIAFLFLIVTSCSKPEVVDVRDNLTGTYITTAKRTITENGKTDVRTDNSLLLTISKGTDNTELVFFDSEYWKAKLNSNTFTATPYYSVQGGISYLVTANGTFTGKSITYTETITANGFKQVSEITGTK